MVVRKTPRQIVLDAAAIAVARSARSSAPFDIADEAGKLVTAHPDCGMTEGDLGDWMQSVKNAISARSSL